jgi:hypothetical protein
MAATRPESALWNNLSLTRAGLKVEKRFATLVLPAQVSPSQRVRLVSSVVP